MMKALENLKSDDEDLRLYAVEELAQRMDDKMFHLLLDQLKLEQSILVRNNLVLILENAISERKVGGGSTFAKIFSLYLSHNAFLRSSAIQILSAGDDVVARFLEANFADANADVRKLILDTLNEIGTPRAMEAVRRALSDSNVNVLITAIEYLGHAADRKVIHRLLEMLKVERRPMVSMAILTTVEEVGTEVDIHNALAEILPGGDIGQAKGIFFAIAIKLLAKVWSEAQILELLESPVLEANLESYSVELVDLLTVASQRFLNFIDHPAARRALARLLQAPNRSEKMPFIALNLLAHSKEKQLSSHLDRFFEMEDINAQDLSRSMLDMLQKQAN